MKTFRTTVLVRIIVGMAVVLGGLGVQSARAASAAPSGTLVLYDSTGAYGFLGEMYAIEAINLASRFGSRKAKKVTSYVANEMSNYQAVIYLGSTYDEPLPTAFLDDVIAQKSTVMWLGSNIWQLPARQATTTGTYFVQTDGWDWTEFDTRAFTTVTYKGRVTTRDGQNEAGIMGVEVSNPAIARVLATASTAAGESIPWATRSRNLTFIGEMPFAYVNESDRYLIFADLMFDALAPTTPERHQAVLRIEDVSSASEPADIRAIADYLKSVNVPFALQIIPTYRDPAGVYNDGVSLTRRVSRDPAMVAALKYAQTKGATLVMHGNTHQLSGVINPYNQVTGDDFEFYKAYVDDQNFVRLTGPSNTGALWNNNRLQAGLNELALAGLAPKFHTVPHYAGSVQTYKAITTKFTGSFERRLYFPGLLSNTAINYSREVGQFFPFPVTDVYGGRIVPENLGNEELDAFNNNPPRLPADIIRNAKTALVVRDNVAGFFWHHYLASDPRAGVAHLGEIVTGMKALGYTFVSPAAVLASTPTSTTGAAVLGAIGPTARNVLPVKRPRADDDNPRVDPNKQGDGSSVKARKYAARKPARAVELGDALNRRADRGVITRLIKVDAPQAERSAKNPARTRGQ